MEPLTTEEATRLIKLTKQSLIDILSSPDPGANVEFDASHEAVSYTHLTLPTIRLV